MAFIYDRWENMSAHQREPVRVLLQAIADYQVDAASANAKPAPVDVIASSVSRDQGVAVTLHFFFSKYEYVFAQSGSDWGEHRFYLGTAKFSDGRLQSVSIEETIVTLSERECDDYDVAAGAAAARAEAARRVESGQRA